MLGDRKGFNVLLMDQINALAAQVVRDAIHDARLTQSSVLQGARIAPTTWRHRMRGERPFTLVELVRIAKLLDLPGGRLVNEILERAA